MNQTDPQSQKLPLTSKAPEFANATILRQRLDALDKTKSTPDERLAAAREIYEQTKQVEMRYARDPFEAGVGEIRALRQFIGDISAVVSRLEAGARARGAA